MTPSIRTTKGRKLAWALTSSSILRKNSLTHQLKCMTSVFHIFRLRDQVDVTPNPNPNTRETQVHASLRLDQKNTVCTCTCRTTASVVQRWLNQSYQITSSSFTYRVKCQVSLDFLCRIPPDISSVDTFLCLQLIWSLLRLYCFLDHSIRHIRRRPYVRVRC